MKLTVSALLLAALAGGCVQHREASLSPITAPPALDSRPASGTLVVYSAWHRTGTDQPDQSIHSNYDVLTSAGKPFLHVTNFITPMLEDPASVQLAAGQYVVNARVQGQGFVKVPVTIESGKVTTLYMDNSTRPGNAERGNLEEVKLSDGRVIGWANIAAR